jgi:hypothetical protein
MAMMTRRVVLVAAGSALIGCAHQRNEGAIGYREVFSMLAISPAGDQLAIVGESYDYIFKPPKPLIDALRSALRQKLSAEFHEFGLKSFTEINGHWVLLVAGDNLLDEDIALAQSLGFEKTSRGYSLSGSIKGVRFLKNQSSARYPVEHTNRSYRVEVWGAPGSQTSTAMERSPITFENGLMLIGLLMLVPLLMATDACITCK